MQHRPEIDGLRAVAVGSVVLAHAGVGVVAGGFVGVDVFFVISGYLITTLMLADHVNGRFSLSTFYYRRARRILPALFVVLAACLPFAWWLLIPSQFMDFGRSMGAAAIFLSNVYFWEKTSYFDTASELLPLLHTWSLAVEEQYYLLFPLLFLLIRRFVPRAMPFLLTILIILSAGLAHWGANNRPEVNFFFSFSRFWEILIGALTACLPAPQRRPWNAGLAMVGLGLIASAVFGFSNSTATPSLMTFLPVAGAALVLAFGSQPGWAYRLLTYPPMLGLGAISYSVYLWHQPVFAFARLYYVAEVPVAVMTGLVAVVIVLSCLSWKYVEQPFRQSATFSKSLVYSLSAAGIAGFVALGSWLHVTDLNRYRYSPDELRLLEYGSFYREKTMATEDGRFLTRCFGDDSGTERADLATCLRPQPNAPIIWGDSHAQALASGFLRLGVRPGLAAAPGCLPLVGDGFPGQDSCTLLTEEFLSELARIEPTPLLILHANWNLAVDGKYAQFADPDALVFRLAETLDTIREIRPEARVLLVGGVPQWGDGLPSYLYRLGLELNAMHRIAPPDPERILAMNERLRLLAAEHGVLFIDPFDVLCNIEGCIASFKYQGQMVPTAWDYGHLTAEGATLVASQLLRE